MGIGDTDFGVQVGIGFLGRVVGAIVAFFGSILLARVLGPTDYGAFYLLLSIVAFLDNPMTGWANACRKRLTEVDFPSEEAIGSIVLAIITTSIVVFGLSWLASDLIASFVEETVTIDPWLMLAILFVGMIAYHTANEVLKSTEHFGASPWLNASRDVIRVGAQAALVLAGLGLAGMVGGMVLANLVVAPVALYLIGVRPRMPSMTALQEIWEYAKYSIPGGVVGTAQHRMDRVLLGVLVSTATLGHYEVAIKLTMPAMFVAGVAQDGLMGRISNRLSREEDVTTDIRRNLGHASVLGIPLFFGVAVLAEPVVVTLYSNQYAAAAPYLIGLALFRVFRTQKSILVATINGFDRPDANLRVATAVFSFNIVFGLLLLFAIGPLGVVVATVISEVLGYLARARIVRKLVPSITFVPRPLLDQIVAGAIMAVVIYGLRLLVPLARWPAVIGLVGVGAVVYGVTLITISRHFRETMIGVAKDAGLLQAN